MKYRNETIRVFQSAGYSTYIVTIGDDCFEMSIDGYLPTGVNVYLGPVPSVRFEWAGKELTKIPERLKMAIDARL